MSKNINDLREVLFDTLQQLKSGKMTVEHAKAMSDVAQTIINTAKVEIDYIKATGNERTTDFISQPESLPKGVVSVRRHRLIG